MKDYGDVGDIGPHELWILIVSLVVIVMRLVEIFDKELFDEQ